MNWVWELIAALASIVANALVVSFLLGRIMQKFEDHLAALVKDVTEHETRLDANDTRFDRHEGKIVRLTVAGAQAATALAMKFNNPHPEPIFQEIARSYERIHGGTGCETAT